MSSVLFVGEYQLRNLVNNQVLFLYFDFRKPPSRAKEEPNHPIFRGSIPCTIDVVAERASRQALTKEHPIVLICENGETSMTAARELEKLGYTNIFVLRGGTEDLDLAQN